MVARTDRLQLVLEANADKLTAGVNKAAKSLEGLDKATSKGLGTVEARFTKLERAVAASLSGIENRIGRVGGRISAFGSGSTAALDSFASSTAASLDRAIKILEAFAAESIRTRNQLEKLQDVNLDRLGAGLRGAAKGAGDLGDATERGAKGGRGALEGFEKGVDSLIGKVGSALFSVQALFASAATGAGVGAPVKFAADFERSLAGVDTLLEEGSVAISKYREQLLDLSGRSSNSLIDLTEGLNDAISAGIPAIEGAGGAFDVLEASQRAATAAGAKTKEVVSGVSTVLNVYSDAGFTATNITDKFFVAAGRGATTIPELSASLGQVASIAKGFGVSLDEVLGVLTALTKGGLSTAESVSALRQILISTAKPPKEVADQIAKLNEEVKGANIEFGVSAIKQKGLVKILEELSTATGGSAEAFSKLFTDVDGLKGVLNLSSQGFASVRKEVDAVSKAAGATDTAYKKVSGTFNETFAVLKNRVLAVLVDAGQRVLPQVQAAFVKFGDFVVKNQTKIAETFEKFASALFSIGAFLVDKGPGILKFFATFFAVKKIAEATKALSGFLAKLKDARDAGESGAESAEGFLSAFQKVFTKIGPAFKNLLKSAPVIGAFVAAGIELGEAIIDGIADVLYEQLDKVITDAAKAAQNEAERIARERGFENTAEQIQSEADFKAGRVVAVGVPGTQTAIKKDNLKTVDEVFEALGEQVASQVLLERLQQLDDDANRAATAARDARNEIASLDKAIGKTGGTLADRETVRGLAAEQEKVKALAVEYQNAEVAARAAAEAIRSRVQSIAEEREFAAADAELTAKAEADRAAAEKAATDALAAKAKKERDAEEAKRKGAENARRRAQELERAIALGEAARADAKAQRIASAQDALETLVQLEKEGTVSAVALAEERGASEQAVIDIQLEGARRIRALVEEQVKLIQQAAAAEIEAAKAAADKQIAEAKRSTEAQAALRDKLAQDVLGIETRAARESAKARQVADKSVTDAERQRRIEAARRNPQAPTGTSGDALGFLGRAQQIAGIARDPLAAVAAIPGPIGTAAQAVQLVGEVPAILNNISDFLDGGFEKFATAFFDSLVRFGEVLFRRLPELLGGLLNNLIPNLVRGFFDKAPEFIAAFITDFLPALFEGLGRLVERLIDALTGGAKSLFGGGQKDSVPGLVGRTIGTSLLGKVVSGDFGGISAEDIPLIGGFFHKGGTTHESGRNPLAAAAMTGSVPAFATGGIVEGVSRRIRNAFGGVFTDDVPALLQAGEGVLRRQAVDRLGGPNAVDAINRGGGIPGGATEVRIEARDGAVRDLLAMIVSKITVEAKTPGTGLQTALQQNPRALGTNDVRARRLG